MYTPPHPQILENKLNYILLFFTKQITAFFLLYLYFVPTFQEKNSYNLLWEEIKFNFHKTHENVTLFMFYTNFRNKYD